MSFFRTMITMLLAAMVAGLYAADAGKAGKDEFPQSHAETSGEASPTLESTRGLLDDFQLRGDLDGDGEEEFILAIWDSPPGSGVFNYLVMLDLREGKVVSHSVFVGDRVRILGGDIRDNKVSIDLIEHAENDPACCPTQKANRTWEYESSGGFRELPVELRGKIGVEELSGTEWKLRKLDDADVPEELEINLYYEDGRIRGSAGCNRYFADMKDQEEAGGDVEVGPVGSTRKACPADIMEMETRFLKHLGNVNHFEFLGRQLSLSWKSGEESGVLLFEPGKREE